MPNRKALVGFLLYRIGQASFVHRRVVASVWLLMLVLTGIGAATLSEPTSDTFSIPGTQAQEAIDLLEKKFPQASADGASAQVVFAAPAGTTVSDPENKAAITDFVANLNGTNQVTAALDPFTSRAVSPDGRVAYAQVQYKVPFPELDESTKEHLVDAVAEARAAAAPGFAVEVGGDALQETHGGSATEGIGIAVAAFVLVVTFGSLVAAGLPLLTALVGVGIGMGGVTIATGFIELSSTATVLALMLGLAVGIDYALFIVSRYRHELAIGHTGADAAGRAVGTAGSAVVFAGATVIIALAALSVVGIPFLTAMGLAAAATVAISVAIAVSLLPALLGFTGSRILSRKTRAAAASTISEVGDPESGHNADGKPAAGERWARFVTRHKIPVVLAVVVGLGVMAYPATDMELGLPSAATAAPDTTQRKAYDLLSEGFGPGFNGPLLVVVDGTDSPDTQAAATTIAGAIAKTPGVVAVTPPVLNPAGDTALLTAVPKTGPTDAATTDLVNTIRAESDRLAKQTGGVLGVTGSTAMGIDISDKLADALLPYLSVIIGLALILLLLVFRSLLVPVKATLGFLLTMGATFGAVVAVFQWGWFANLLGIETGPIMSMLPIFMIGVVFGLAMDYQIFLVTRMREEYVHGAPPVDAVIGGVSHGARVVTAAALIMVSVFAGFMLSGESMIMSMGFAMAFGVFIDAFVVRMTLVPAVMGLINHAAWWLPAWLDKVLPNVDVEGEQLQKALTVNHASPTSTD